MRISRFWRGFLLMALLVGLLIGFYPSLRFHYACWQYQQDITQQSLFALIAKTEPKAFDAFVQQVVASREVGSADNQAQLSARFIHQIYQRHLNHAPDASIMQNLQATLALYDYLYQQSPIQVIRFEQGQVRVDNADMQALLVDEAFVTKLIQVLESKRFLIEGAIEHPQQNFSADRAKLIYDQLTQAIKDKYNEQAVEILSKSFEPEMSIEQSAQVILAFYQGLINLGPENAGQVMRYLATKQATKAG